MNKKAIEEERGTIRTLISLIRCFCVALFFLPAWFLYNQEISAGPSDGSGVVKLVRWEESPKEFLALMLLTLFCLGIVWALGAYINKHLRAQIAELESKLSEAE